MATCKHAVEIESDYVCPKCYKKHVHNFDMFTERVREQKMNRLIRGSRIANKPIGGKKRLFMPVICQKRLQTIKND